MNNLGRGSDECTKRWCDLKLRFEGNKGHSFEKHLAYKENEKEIF